MRRLLLVAAGLLVPLSVYGQDTLEVIGGNDGAYSMAKWDVNDIDSIKLTGGIFQAFPVQPYQWPMPVPVRKMVFHVTTPLAGCADNAGVRQAGFGVPDPREVRMNSAGRATSFLIPVSASGSLHIAVYGSNGRIVKELYSAAAGAGLTSATWDHMAANRRPVSPGVYHLRATLDGITLCNKVFITR